MLDEHAERLEQLKSVLGRCHSVTTVVARSSGKVIFIGNKAHFEKRKLGAFHMEHFVPFSADEATVYFDIYKKEYSKCNAQDIEKLKIETGCNPRLIEVCMNKDYV